VPSPRNAGDLAQHDSAARALGRLTRTFPAQIEALNRYRAMASLPSPCRMYRSGTGKAIVGNVTQHASVIVSDKGPGAAARKDAEGRGLPATARFRWCQAGSAGMSAHIRNTSPMLESPRCGAKTVVAARAARRR